jgi:hypothetical protein
MKTKPALGVVAAILIAGIAVLVFLWLRLPQQIRLPDGTRLTLAAVTYGKHHLFSAPKIARKRVNTATDTLCVWVREDFTNQSPGKYTVFVLDKSGAYCAGNAIVQRYPAGQGVDIACLRLAVFPRRDGKLRLQIKANDSQGETPVMKNEFVVTFPAQKPSAEWQPQSLPDTQEGDDLTVTLTKLVHGVSFTQPKNPAATDPTNQAVLAAFRIEHNDVIATNWQPVRIESWDATGNHSISGTHKIQRDGDETMMIYKWGLSPDEPAWKLHAEFVRTSGFGQDEQWTVAGIPIVTNANPQLPDDPANAFSQTKLGNSTLMVYPAQRLANGQISVHVSVDPAPPAPENLYFTLVEATDGNGKKIKSPSRSWGGINFHFNFNANNAQTINATFALQGDHFAEFTVKPEKQ